MKILHFNQNGSDFGRYKQFLEKPIHHRRYADLEYFDNFYEKKFVSAAKIFAQKSTIQIMGYESSFGSLNSCSF